MIKQNIKIAIVSIIVFITFWLVMFNFIKIDHSTQCLIYFEDAIPMMSIDINSSSYIKKHEIDNIRVEFNKQYFYCHITLIESSEQEFDTYQIFLPEGVYKSQPYLLTNTIIDSQNIYEYWFKK